MKNELEELQEDYDLLVAELGTLREELDTAQTQRDAFRNVLREIVDALARGYVDKFLDDAP